MLSTENCCQKFTSVYGFGTVHWYICLPSFLDLVYMSSTIPIDLVFLPSLLDSVYISSIPTGFGISSILSEFGIYFFKPYRFQKFFHPFSFWYKFSIPMGFGCLFSIPTGFGLNFPSLPVSIHLFHQFLVLIFCEG